MTTADPEGSTIQVDIPSDERPERDTELIPPREKLAEMKELIFHLETDATDPSGIRRGLFALHRIATLAESVRDQLVQRIYANAYKNDGQEEVKG